MFIFLIKIDRIIISFFIAAIPLAIQVMMGIGAGIGTAALAYCYKVPNKELKDAFWDLQMIVLLL